MYVFIYYFIICIKHFETYNFYPPENEVSNTNYTGNDVWPS